MSLGPSDWDSVGELLEHHEANCRKLELIAIVILFQMLFNLALKIIL